MNCYAETLSLRMGWSSKPWTARNAPENVILHPDRLHAPYGWDRKAIRTGETIRCFVNSMSDLFHEQIPDSFLDRVFHTMEHCPHVIFQILTKRPERQRDYMTARYGESARAPRNIWCGTSVEDQRRAHERIPVLGETPAAMRFLSMEPLLAPVDLRSEWFYDPCPGNCGCIEPTDADRYECGCIFGCCGPASGLNSEDWWAHRSPRIGWIIVGGETGPVRRGMEKEWAEELRDRCEALRVPFFFKQASALKPGQQPDLLGRLYHEFPEVEMPVEATLL